MKKLPNNFNELVGIQSGMQIEVKNEHVFNIISFPNIKIGEIYENGSKINLNCVSLTKTTLRDILKATFL